MSGARRRYHPMTPAVVKRLAHELDVIERAGLAEFFLICWDLMRFAKERGIPAQGRGSAADSIVSYTLGISRVEPIRHNLLFERFINAGRTTYPDVDIDFSSERREEVIQYVYERYGPEHTGMVCNLVTYRARSAVREVGYALGFPRPLVDRVAKALETYDSVMVRRDLEADGGFAEFFRRPDEGLLGAAEASAARPSRSGRRRLRRARRAPGLVDGMGQLDHARGGRIRTGGAGEAGNGRLPRLEDACRLGGASAGEPGRRLVRPEDTARLRGASAAACRARVGRGRGPAHGYLPGTGRAGDPGRRPLRRQWRPAADSPASVAWLVRGGRRRSHGQPVPAAPRSRPSPRSRPRDRPGHRDITPVLREAASGSNGRWHGRCDRGPARSADGMPVLDRAATDARTRPRP